jgi:hypothetical protein
MEDHNCHESIPQLPVYLKSFLVARRIHRLQAYPKRLKCGSRKRKRKLNDFERSLESRKRSYAVVYGLGRSWNEIVNLWD